ncbi:Gfo/Idh/MocA family oxidoreductase [Agreia sp. COWG]|uniref:Gfo/Idh/MocA family protein n=1 Tax=Agreia sp. COWG TaxID=2773266 RepID=UPI0019283851|nr:Gfo/Idh/MocA family oxidoreductase [Agreia sp. COWG]CAD6009513.1 Oxidoreductase [Agreia sp. COWG]
MSSEPAARIPFARPIRTGIVGFGLSGRVFHAPFLAANPDYVVSAIVTSNPERAEEARRLHPAALILQQTAELFDRAARGELDLIVIGSPSGTHFELADRALDSGVAVVVDKPFAVRSAEGRALIEKADRLGLAFTVFQNRRWDGDFLTLSSLLAAGQLGEVRRFESRFEWWKPVQAKSWKAEATASEGGGILYDLGVHLIDQALQLFGDVDEIHAEVVTRRENGRADDDTTVLLSHRSGVRTQLWMNGMAAQVGARFHVLGSESAYTSWGLDPQEAQLRAGALPTDDGFGVYGEDRWGLLGIDGDVLALPTQAGKYALFYELLADALLRGQPVPVDPRDSLRSLEIIERIHEEAGSY